MTLYIIRNTTNGMEYVGTTIQSPHKRWLEHQWKARTGRRSPLYDAMREMGVAAFVLTPLETSDSYEALLQREREEIAARNTLTPSGYNVVKGGRGNYGWKMRPETRQKIADKAMGRIAWNRGIPLSAETRAKLSAVRKGRMSDAQRAAHDKQKGRPLSEEHRAALRASHVGYVWTEAHRKACEGKMSRSEEVRAINAEKRRQWWAALTPDARAAHIKKMTAGHSQ